MITNISYLLWKVVHFAPNQGPINRVLDFNKPGIKTLKMKKALYLNGFLVTSKKDLPIMISIFTEESMRKRKHLI